MLMIFERLVSRHRIDITPLINVDHSFIHQPVDHRAADSNPLRILALIHNSMSIMSTKNETNCVAFYCAHGAPHATMARKDPLTE